MVNVSNIVEKIVEKKPFLQEALSKGIINNAALAEEIKADIEKELGKPVKFSAVNMAIRRLSEKLKDTFIEKTKFDNTSDITIKSNLVEIILHKIEDIQESLGKIYEKVDLKRGDFLTITQGLYEVMIITNSKYEEQIIKMLPKKAIKKEIKELSSLTINLPENAVETPGFFYITTRALNWENINIVDIVSTYTEMTYILKEEDISRAFDTLKKLVGQTK